MHHWLTSRVLCLLLISCAFNKINSFSTIGGASGLLLQATTRTQSPPQLTPPASTSTRTPTRPRSSSACRSVHSDNRIIDTAKELREPLSSLSSSMQDSSSSGMASSAAAVGRPPLFSSSSKFSSERNGLARRRRWLVVDFDGTCTEHDTTPLLPRLAAFAHRSRSSILSDTTKSSTHHEEGEKENMSDGSVVIDRVGSGISLVGEEYDHKQDLDRRLALFQELENEFLKRFGVAKDSLSKLDDGSDDALLTIHDVLDALDVPSNIVTKMVSESRVLHGLGHADSRELEEILHLHGTTTVSTERNLGNASNSTGEGIADTTGEMTNDDVEKVIVRLRHGCEGTLARILFESLADNEHCDQTSCLGWSLAVLSINWCPALIDASLVKPVLRKRQHLRRGEQNDRQIIESDEGQNYDDDTEIPVWSNHVDGDGVVTLHVPGALAKRDKIAELRRSLNEECEFIKNIDSNIDTERSSSLGTRSMIVYVGDSSTDLAALLEADIGIIMGKSSSTFMIAERWGIQIFPLQHRGKHGFRDTLLDDNSKRSKNHLWQVESWQEIDDMLRELDEYWA